MAMPTTNPTLIDWAKRVDPDGSIPVIANLLSQTNEILTDATYVEGNLPTGHRVTVATGLPTVYWRSLNQGIPTSKATTAQVDEACGILEARSEIDKDLAMLNGNTAAFRLSEARMFIEAMNQKKAYTDFYGNPATDPKEYLGLSHRYSVLAAGNGANIISAGGTGGGTAGLSTGGTNTSVWLVCWSPETVFCPFPKGSRAGLEQRDLGEQTIYDGNDRMQALVEWFQWKSGLAVKDWRYAVRIANIGAAELSGFSGAQELTDYGTQIIHAMVKAVYRIPNLSMGRCAFYMNRTTHAGLSRMALEKSNGVLAIKDGISQFGTPRAYMDFMGIPIRRCDAITNTEAQIV